MKRWLLNALALGLVLAFVALGRWQLDREQQKRAQLAAADAALAAPPLALADALATSGDAPLRVQGDAVFRAAPPLWLDNQRRGPRVGVRQYCVADAGGQPLLVDLGWLPMDGARALPTQPCPTATQPLAGLLVPPPSPGMRLGDGLAQQPDGSWLAMRLETDAVATAMAAPGLAPRVLRLDPALPLGFERDLDLLPNTLPPQKHRGYAVQWFGLATAMVVIAAILNFRRKTP